MTIYSPATPETALVLSGGSESIDPGLAKAFAAFDAISADWPTIDLRPSFHATPEDPERFNGVDLEETPRDQVEAPVLIAAETAPEQSAPKGWLSRVRKAVKTGGEWIASKRDRITIAVGFAAVATTVSEGKETLDDLELKGTLGGVMRGLVELMANTSASEHLTSTGVFSAASFSAIGVGLAMRKGLPRRSRPKPGEVGLSELMAPGRQQSLDHIAFAERLAYYQGVICETDDELQHLAEAYTA